MKTLPINGYPMAYTERGAGPTVVFVHGITSDYRYWQPQLEALAGRYRVVSVSLRHYYPERWNGVGEDFSIYVHADDLAAFIERLDVGPVYLVGHSRGGSVVAGTARLRPELVKKLVLAEPSLFSLDPGAAIHAPDPAVIRIAIDMLNRGDIEAGLEYYVDGTSRRGTWRAYSEGQKQIIRDNAWTIVSGLRHTDIVSCDGLHNMGMPMLFVEGEDGPQFLHDIVNEALKCAPAAERVVISRAGHRMNKQNVPAFDRAIVRFIEEAR